MAVIDRRSLEEFRSQFLDGWLFVAVECLITGIMCMLSPVAIFLASSFKCQYFLSLFGDVLIQIVSRNKSNTAGITHATFIQRTINIGNQTNFALVLDKLTQQYFFAAIALIFSGLALAFMVR